MSDIKKYEKEEELLAVLDKQQREMFKKVKLYMASLVKERASIKTKQASSKRVVGAGKNETTGKWEKIYGDYLTIKYFKELINKELPDLWDWEPAHQPIFAANRLVITDGVFSFFNKERFNLFTAMGVSPDVAIKYSWKRFYSVGADYYQFNDTGSPISKSGPPKIANIEAFKKGGQMDTDFGSDTYGFDYDLIMPTSKLEHFIEQLLELELPDEEREIFVNKLLGFNEFHMPNFFATIQSSLPISVKIEALDSLVTLSAQSMDKYSERLKEREKDYVDKNKE
jgi:hypothetical protein